MGKRTIRTWTGNCSFCGQSVSGGGVNFVPPEPGSTIICMSCVAQSRHQGASLYLEPPKRRAIPRPSYGLADHGIQQDKSRYRVHVCYRAKRLYIYETAAGRRIAASDQWRYRPAYQDGVAGPTAGGYLIPPTSIPGCRAIQVDRTLWQAYALAPQDSTSDKGRKAEQLVLAAIRQGTIFGPVENARQIKTKPAQYDGVDILVAQHGTVQVKCDAPGGDIALGGTGNLYIQMEEINVLHRT